MHTLQRFSSRFGFIMATTGAAVGLGNIWKFPYMAGDNGGSAFILVYLLAVLFIGMPVFMSEVMLGRIAKSNPVSAFEKLSLLSKASPYWSSLGWLGAFTLLFVLAFYSVVSGWSIAYIIDACNGVFQNLSANEINIHFDNLLASPFRQVLWHSVFMLATLSVVGFGVKSGLERLSKIMMPGLFLILLGLTIFSFFYGDIEKASNFLLKARFEQLSVKVVISALGHAFFTLAIGAGAMLVYGAYTPEKINLTRSLGIIALLDVMVAFLAGFAIFPILFAQGLDASAGPGLMFKILPITFHEIPFGQGVGVLFFVLLLFASWTSSISMAEPLVLLLVERTSLSRKASCVIVGALCWSLGLVSAFSFNIWSHVKIFDMGLFQVMTDLPTNYLLPLGGISYTIFAGFILPKNLSQEGLGLAGFKYAIWRLLVRTVAPVGILIVLGASFFYGS